MLYMLGAFFFRLLCGIALELEIEVGTNLCTVDYDYPAFHLNMQCFWATIKAGTPVLKEHEAVRWLTRTELKSVAWLPADVEVIERIAAEQMRDHR